MAMQITDAADIQSSNYLHLENLDFMPGETKTVKMLMTNANTVSAIQGNIKLPDGFSFVTKSNGRVDAANINERAEDFTLSCAIQDDGSLTFAQYSADGFTFEGSEGGIFTFKIKADDNIIPGTYDAEIGTVVMSIGGVGYDMTARTCAITVSSSTGIQTIENKQTAMGTESGAWYTPDGLRLGGKPSRKGLYINNGKKVVIK